MKSVSLYDMSITELKEKLDKGSVSSVEITEEYLKRIKEYNPSVNAVVYQHEEMSLQMAKEADKRLQSGEKGPLLGIPLGIKDILNVKGTPTGCCSRILSGYTSPYDATVIAKLKEAGAVFVGKLNMDEFAMGSSNETSVHGAVHNPWNPDCVPGGSSGGSAAAVAAGFAPASLGSDTGGSIRQPAAFCGVTGLKPTYGRVSRFGLLAFASSLDQIGPLAHTVEDCALLLNAIAGNDPLDATSSKEPAEDFTARLKDDIKGLKIGLPKEYFDVEGIDPDVSSAIKEAIETYKELGATFVEVELPHSRYAVPTYYVIAPAEASSNLSRYDGVRYGYRSEKADELVEMYSNTKSEGFGLEVKRRILIGTFALSSGYYDAYYLKAQKLRTLIKQDFDKAFEQCDILLSATTPTPAFRIGEKLDDPISMYLSDIFTISVNLAGLPALSLPCGLSSGKLPIGMQLIARPFAETQLCQVAHQFQKRTGFHTLHSPVMDKK